MSCPFCHPDAHDAQHVLLENAHCRLLRKAQDVLEGAAVIVPKAHRATVFDLTEEEWAATFELLHKAKTHLDDVFAPEGYNVGWNCGEVAGQKIPHAHLHVIPRFPDEPLAGKGLRFHLKQPINKRA